MTCACSTSGSDSENDEFEFKQKKVRHTIATIMVHAAVQSVYIRPDKLASHRRPLALSRLLRSSLLNYASFY